MPGINEIKIYHRSIKLHLRLCPASFFFINVFLAFLRVSYNPKKNLLALQKYDTPKHPLPLGATWHSCWALHLRDTFSAKSAMLSKNISCVSPQVRDTESLQIIAVIPLMAGTESYQ